MGWVGTILFPSQKGSNSIRYKVRSWMMSSSVVSYVVNIFDSLKDLFNAVVLSR